MANIYEAAVEVSRRTMTLFFIVDASGSMDGAKMGTLNSAIEEVIPEIRKISAENADAAIKIAFMSDVAGSFAPAIFLLSDGEPTDEYSSELSKLMENNWFKKAIKVAVAIGEDANKAVLAEFTGNKEAVLTVHTPEALTKMIRFVSVTASQIGSKSSGVGKGGVDEAANKQDEMIDKINEVKAAEPDDDGDLEW